MGLSALPNFSKRHRVPAENRNEDGKPGAFAPQSQVSLACMKPLFSLRKSLSLISNNRVLCRSRCDDRILHAIILLYLGCASCQYIPPVQEWGCRGRSPLPE